MFYLKLLYLCHFVCVLVYNYIEYRNKEVPTGLRQDSNPRRLRQLRLAITDTSLTNCTATLLPRPPKQ